jgi:hypothetical protein
MKITIKMERAGLKSINHAEQRYVHQATKYYNIVTLEI